MSKRPSGKTSHSEAQTSASALLQGALDATLTGNAANAVELLLALLQREPNNAAARHLLGAQYAKAGKIEEAVIEMAIALELNPALHLARFQLGLLLLTSGAIDNAAAIWAPLDALGEQHPLQRFKTGMLFMVQERFDDARNALQEARAINIEFTALNKEIDVALSALEERDAAPVAIEPEPEAIAKEVIETRQEQPDESENDHDKDKAGGQHILVSAYAQSRMVH